MCITMRIVVCTGMVMGMPIHKLFIGTDIGMCKDMDIDMAIRRPEK